MENPRSTKFLELRDEPDAPFPEGGLKDVIGKCIIGKLKDYVDGRDEWKPPVH